MTLLFACILWVFASAACAMLPIRNQYIPAVILLIAAPVLIVWIGYDVHPLAAIAAVAAFVSMFRNPLRYLYARLKGEQPELPK
jgi:hypothetical protein